MVADATFYDGAISLNYLSFTDIIYFTEVVKVGETVKRKRSFDIECMINKFLNLPNVDKCQLPPPTANAIEVGACN